MRFIILIFIFFFSPISLSGAVTNSDISNNVNHNLKQDLIDTFNNICFENRNNIAATDDLSKILNWKRYEKDELFGFKKYEYKGYILLIKEDAADITCTVNSNNKTDNFQNDFIDEISKKYKPISNIYTEKEYSEITSDIYLPESDSTTRRWFIEGGFVIKVVLRNSEKKDEKSATIILTRF